MRQKIVNVEKLFTFQKLIKNLFCYKKYYSQMIYFQIYKH